ncbi:serine hydrolase domain-containing protein [Winogradskyella flava]|uniref:Beta-lactamase family protein n=1 Tax=Winogradskyella flava TaxID=1884876 RepID=A0A842INH4_9FLAO|nr:serine hydrolase domain-containing protein [Winogradskyella flava]MBC2844205.1 beta-lactamase family protein [Winogradskyella flava]
MKYPKILYVLLLIFVFSCKEEKKTSAEVAHKTEVFQSILDSIYNQNKDAVGLMIHIESPDKGISWSGVAGYSDKSETELEKDQPVLIASNTKTYVSAAILKLVEQSKFDLNQAIDTLIFEKTNKLLKTDGYDTSQIKIAQLLNHTSGIYDYAGTEEYMQLIKDDPKHRYSRNEQIQLAVSMGNPLGKAGEVFAYADTNYLLLTEIIEGITDKPFYIALRELIGYEKLGMQTTWFSTLEDYPQNTKPLVHQYWTSEGLDSYEVDHSFDLYGGGGIASTSKDLAVFCQSLFNNKIFDKANTLDLIYAKANPEQPMEGDYYLGISSVDFDGLKGYGHGGFWGTAVNYFPELNSSIAVFVLDRDKRILRVNINEAIVKALSEL